MFEDNTVYIVESNRSIQEKVSELVTAMGCRVCLYDIPESFWNERDIHQPSCLLLAEDLSGTSGIELLERMSDAKCRTPVIFQVNRPTTALTVRAMKAGAINVLEKPCRENELWRAIQEALTRATSWRQTSDKTRNIRRKIASLSLQEGEVLEMVIDGMPNKRIARRLGVSMRTIESRRSNIFRIIGADSIAVLVRMVVEARMASGAPAMIR